MDSTRQKEQCFDIVENLKLAGTPATGIEDLIVSARRAFQILEPWSQATTSSESPLVVNIIIRVKEQTSLYFRAIDASVETSEHGITFAEEATELCQFLRDGKPAADLIVFIQDLQRIARVAHDQAKATLDKFRSVRIGILELTKHIPSVVEQIIEEYDHLEASKHRNQMAGDCAGFVRNMATGATAVILATAGASIPHLSIILPVLLPLVAIITGKIEERCQYNAEARAQEQISCKEALSKLEVVNNDMQDLLHHTAVFTNWWHSIDMKLGTIKAALEKSGSPRLDPPLIATIIKRWAEVADQHHAYISEISKIQDFYPSDSPDGKTPISSAVVQLEVSLQTKLAVTLSSLTQHVDDCQIAFHNLWLASSDVKSKYLAGLRVQLGDIRICLKTEWEALQCLLLQILHLDVNIAMDDDHHTARDATEEIKNATQALLDLHKNTSEKFRAHQRCISNLLRCKLSSRRRSVRRITNLISTIKAIPEPSHGDESDRGSRSSFLENALASIHPNGPKALYSLERAICDNGSSIEQLSNCLNRTLTRNFSAQIHAGDQRSPLSGSPWHLDQDAMNRAIMSISTSSDSLTTETAEHSAKQIHSRSHQ